MRQLIIKQNPDKKGLVLLQDKDFHYLRQVLRVKVGDMLVLRLLNGESCNSTVCKIDDKAKTITLQLCGARDAVVPEPVEGHQLPGGDPSIEYTLFQFIPKPQKLELIVRQATECGVKRKSFHALLFTFYTFALWTTVALYHFDSKKQTKKCNLNNFLVLFCHFYIQYPKSVYFPFLKKIPAGIQLKKPGRSRAFSQYYYVFFSVKLFSPC